MSTLRIWPVAVGFLCAAVPPAAATTTTVTRWLCSIAAVLLRLLDQDQRLEVAAHFHRRGLIRLAQGAGVVAGYRGGLSRSRLLCLQLSSHSRIALAWRFASKELA